MNYAISPMMPYTPAFASPNLQQHGFPHPMSPALPTPSDWTWSGMGLVTPTHLQLQPQPPDWSVLAVKGQSPDVTHQKPSLREILENSPLTTKKRSHETEDTESEISAKNAPSNSPVAKKQQLPSPTFVVPAVPKRERPPFPFAVPRARPAQAQHRTTSSSTLNPFASEFVFRPPHSAPKLDAAAKEFSPVHLQESSRSLFNVFAPEFKPIFASSSLSMNNANLSVHEANQRRVPSPRKRTTPVVTPEPEDGEKTEVMSEDDKAGAISREEYRDDKAVEKTVEEGLSSSEPPTEDPHQFRVPRAPQAMRKKSPTQQKRGNASSDTDSIDTEEMRHDILALSSPKKSRSQNNLQCSSDENYCADDSPQIPSRPKTLVRNLSAPPMSSKSTTLDATVSPETEFNGYPAFWEQRLLKSEQKAKRDKPFTPRGAVAKSLANELLDGEEDVIAEYSDKENRILPDADDDDEELTDESDESVFGRRKKRVGRVGLLARQSSALEMERIVKQQLQPVLKGLEAVQMGLQRLSAKDREDKRKQEGSDADDEDETVTIKKPGILVIDKIKNTVIEALRQERDRVSPPAMIVDRTAEVKELRSMIDGLKSKLLDSEDSLDREERRRSDVERRMELLSRDLIQHERTLDEKSDKLEVYESELKDLRTKLETALRDRQTERHAREKLDEVIKGIRTTLGQMTDKNSKLAGEVSTLQSLNSTQNGEISSLREDISNARGENGTLQRELTTLERSLEDERTRYANLQNELMETGKAVADQETRWREELTAEKLRVQSLERNLLDEERRAKKLEEECDKLARTAEERAKYKAMVDASMAREKSLEGVVAALEKRVLTAEARVTVAQEERSRFEKQSRSLFEKEKDSLKGEISSLLTTVSNLQQEKMQAHIDLERQNSKIAVQSDKIESLEKQLTQITLEKRKSDESTTREAKETQAQMTALRKEITYLRTNLDKKDHQVASLHETADAARADISEKEKTILELEYIITSTTSPTKKSRDDESFVKLQKRDKEILRLRELLAALLQDNDDLVSQSKELVVPEQQKKYAVMKNILRAERERRKGLERDLARAMAKLSKDDHGRTPGSRNAGSVFDTPSSVPGGLDTPVSLNETPGSLRGFRVGEETPLKGKGVFIE